jgi:hypothetical protein
VTCKEKARLFAEYNQGVSEWAQAVQRLNDQAAVNQSQYLELLSSVDEARAKTHRQKAAFSKHIEEHGC